MSDDDAFLHRWSKRKHAANRGEKPAEPAPAPVSPPAPEVNRLPASAAGPSPLPDVASLTPESDFAPFMREGIPGDVKQRALKTLFQDPRFNVMDGLDVYIDDYSKPDPLPEGWLEQLKQVAYLGDRGQRDAEAAAEAEKARAQQASEAPDGHGTSPDSTPLADTPEQSPPDTKVQES